MAPRRKQVSSDVRTPSKRQFARRMVAVILAITDLVIFGDEQQPRW